jgi:sugar phosphate isomerase/epimerase
MRTLTLGFLNCPEVGALELVDVAAAAGFTSVGVRITGRRLTDAFAPVVGNARALAAIRTRAREAGVRLASISAYHFYPEVNATHLDPLLDAASELGAAMILVACYDADHARFADTIAAFADAAAPRGIRLFLEFVPFSQARSLADALAIVARVDRANFGMIVDPLHLARSGGTPADVAQVPPDRLFFAQLCDAAPECPSGVDLATEARTLRLAPGDGELPLHALLDSLPPELELECEFPTAANLRLPPVQRARGIREAALRFLGAHARLG